MILHDGRFYTRAKDIKPHQGESSSIKYACCSLLTGSPLLHRKLMNLNSGCDIRSLSNTSLLKGLGVYRSSPYGRYRGPPKRIPGVINIDYIACVHKACHIYTYERIIPGGSTQGGMYIAVHVFNVFCPCWNSLSSTAVAKLDFGVHVPRECLTSSSI